MVVEQCLATVVREVMMTAIALRVFRQHINRLLEKVNSYFVYV